MYPLLIRWINLCVVHNGKPSSDEGDEDLPDEDVLEGVHVEAHLSSDISSLLG